MLTYIKKKKNNLFISTLSLYNFIEKENITYKRKIIYITLKFRDFYFTKTVVFNLISLEEEPIRIP